MNDSLDAALKNPVKRGFYTDRVGYHRVLFVRAVYLMVDIVLLLPMIFISALSRLFPRPVDIGIGPIPSINSKYHKMALERFGYRCETFVYYTWYFTKNFDVNIGRFCPRALGPYVSYVYVLFRYKCLYTYFNGGALGFTTLLARLEPYLLQLAGIKTVIMPYGADVQVLTRSQNRLMVHAYARDYPGFRHNKRRTADLVDVWTHNADHIISGCDWVDYLYYWDSLMLSHFAIDTDSFKVVARHKGGDKPCDPLRLIHAPNHRTLKGTAHIIKAVEELQAEGLTIELSLVEGVPNDELMEQIQGSDVVVDQLVIGWYAMFAIEGMALGKPVVCHVRQDFLDLYIGAELLEPGELPLINASIASLKDTFRHLIALPRSELRDIGLRSRAFVEKHHSVEAIGKVFDEINQHINLKK